MLAQSFKSADELGITEPQKSALMKTLVLLETGKLTHVPYENAKDVADTFSFQGKSFSGLFNMGRSFGKAECGTVACIRGTAMLVGHIQFSPSLIPDKLHDLFYSWKGSDPSTEHAATALRSYLTTGDAKWHEAVA